MSSPSPRALSPVAFSLGLLLVLATAFPTPAPRGDQATGDAARMLLAARNATEVIRYTLGKISVLKTELCVIYKCESTKKALAENTLNLPKMADTDGCFHAGFNQETCLIRITSGLLEFQIYLEHLQKVFEGDKKNARDVHNNTKTLVDLLKKKLLNPDEVATVDPSHNANVLSELGRLQSQGGWLQSTIFQVMLQSLEVFLQYSLRAVRIM